MAVDERGRLQLAEAAKRVFGDEVAITLMELLPPVGWADVATKHDLAHLETVMNMQFDAVDRRFGSVDERFDAVDRIIDRGQEHILKEVAATVRRTIAAKRYVHLVLENDQNAARLLDRDAAGRPVFYDAQWNDDSHHVYHHLLTGETAGYYHDYYSAPREAD